MNKEDSESVKTVEEMKTFLFNLVDNGTLKCSICKNILKKPISYVVDIGNICGPCYEAKHDENNWCGHVNEDAAELMLMTDFFTFPCKFEKNGCKIQLKIQDKESHEESCDYGEKVCPLSTISLAISGISCGWCGLIPEFPDHFSKCHPALVELDDMVDNYSFTLHLFVEKNQNQDILMLLSSTNSSKSFVHIHINANEQELYYTLFDAVPLSSINKMVKKPFSMELTGQVSTQRLLIEGHMEDLSKLFSSTKSETHVNFTSLLKSDSGALNINVYTREKILKHLDYFNCNVCLGCLRPPIYLCYSGHSICSVCFAKVEKCPQCKGTYETKSRNYSVEKLMDTIQFPCIYSDHGCEKKDFADKITVHETECLHKQIKCPVENCVFSGKNNLLINHFMENHRDQISFFDDEFSSKELTLRSSNVFKTFFYKHNHLFRFIHSYTTGYSYSSCSELLQWSLEMIGHEESNSITRQFNYEIKIYRKNLKEWCFSARKQCLPQNSNIVSTDKISISRNNLSISSDDVIEYRLKLEKQQK